MEDKTMETHANAANGCRFLLVASDVHDSEACFSKLARKASDPDCIAFLYAGDLNVENYFICEELKYRSFTFLPVLGNCDNPWAWTDAGVQQPPQFRTLHQRNRTGELGIYMSHGHRYPQPSYAGLDDDAFALIITGHSHVGCIETCRPKKLETSHMDGNEKECTAVHLNPGSPSSPRGGSSPSYAVIRIPDEGSAVVELREFFSDDLLSTAAIPLHKVKEGND